VIDRPIGAALNRDIVATGEKVEAELDHFISKRHQQRVLLEGERAVEESWKESTRRQAAKAEADALYSRLVFFKHLRGVYAARTLEYDRIIETLEGNLPKGA